MCDLAGGGGLLCGVLVWLGIQMGRRGCRLVVLVSPVLMSELELIWSGRV